MKIEDDKQYYIQDSRTIVGNCVSWWGPNGGGYTCELIMAGVYSGKEARNISDRSSDVAWEKEAVDAIAIKHVRIEPLLRLKTNK